MCESMDANVKCVENKSILVQHEDKCEPQVDMGSDTIFLSFLVEELIPVLRLSKILVWTLSLRRPKSMKFSPMIV
jgi:hypothetical protein